jgi:hypothetical protein
MKFPVIGALSFLVILIFSFSFWKQGANESSEGLNAWGIDREMIPQAFIICLAFGYHWISLFLWFTPLVSHPPHFC